MHHWFICAERDVVIIYIKCTSGRFKVKNKALFLTN